MSTLALNMIVGNDGHELDRCLSSFPVNEIFDEIVICCNGDDIEVERIAAKYANTIVRHSWRSERYPHGDFAGARNAALDATKSDYVMWLDADDIILEQYHDRFKQAKAIICDDKNAGIEAYFIQYSIQIEADGTPSTFFYRDRIFKRCPRFRWHNPVHELICLDWSNVIHGKINNFAITHMAGKPNYVSALRNVAILEHEYSIGNRTQEIKHFLARDLLCCGREDEGIKIVNEMLCEQEALPENLYVLCLNAMFYKAFGAHITRPMISDFKSENTADVEHWARLAIGMDNRYAEPFVILGDVYFIRNNIDAAERMYKIALSKKINTGTLQTVPYYEEIPAERLMQVYIQRGDYEQALWYSKRSMIHNPDNPAIHDARRQIIAILAGNA